MLWLVKLKSIIKYGIIKADNTVVHVFMCWGFDVLCHCLYGDVYVAGAFCNSLDIWKVFDEKFG